MGYLGKHFGRQDGRSAATDIKSLAMIRELIPAGFHLHAQSVGIGIKTITYRNLRIEIAVGAKTPAKWNMYIYHLI